MKKRRESKLLSLVEEGDTGVALDQATGKYWQLNEVATLILKSARAGQTRDEIVLEILDTFDASEETVAADLDRTLAEMRAQRWIK